MNKYILTIGDQLNDGHGKTNAIQIYCSHTIDELQKAYLESCMATNVYFHRIQNPTKETLYVCVEYGDDQISDEVKERLINFGMDKSLFEFDEEFIDVIEFVDLYMNFIKLSLDFTYQIPCSMKEISNFTIGYGLFN